LPPARGEPIEAPLHGDLDAIAAAYRAELDGPYFVALAVVRIDLVTLGVEMRLVHATGD